MRISVDDGYGNIKVAIETAQGIRKMVIPAHAVAGVSPMIGNEGDDAGIQIVRTGDGEIFTLGQSYQAEDTRFADYATSGMNRALVRYAIRRAGVPDNAIHHLGVGLPVAQYYTGNKPNREAIDAKKRHHDQPVFLVTDRDLPLSIPESVSCFPQSAGVAMAMVHEDIDDDDAVAVVDIGHRTTDVAVFEGGLLMVARSGGFMELGVAAAKDRFRVALEQRFGLNMEHLTDKAFRKQSLLLSGTRFDVSREWQQAIGETAQIIARSVETVMHGTADIARIVLIGGGAMVFGDALLSHWPQAMIHEDPVFANALAWMEIMAEQEIGENGSQ